MGAIVTNRILSLRLQDEDAARVFDNLVLMASASSLQDFQANVLPYMVECPETKLYLLTLHDKAEVLESHVLGLVPAGSLLVWIDNFLSNVRSHAEFRAGRFTPLLQSIHRIDRCLWDRVFIKSFGVDSGDPEYPLMHGDFNDGPFWRESFWRPRTAPAN